MKRRVGIVGAVPVVLLVGLSGACASSVNGNGSGSLAASSSASTTASLTSTAPTTTSTTASAPSARSSASAPSGKTSTISTALLGPATLTSLTATSPACGASTTDKKQITIKWTSKSANEVWIESGPVASVLVNADPKTDNNGQQLNHPLSGSVPAEYDCANVSGGYNYLVVVYNTTNSTQNGESLNVVNN